MGCDDSVNLIKVEWLDIVEKTVINDGECTHRPHIASCISYGEFDYQDEHELVIITEHIGGDLTKQAFPIGCVMRITALKEEY